MINIFKRKTDSVDVENSVRKEEDTLTHIYDNVYLRRESEALYNIYKKLPEDASYPEVKSIIEYVLCDPCEHVVYMDLKLNIVSRYEATNVFVDTGYKTEDNEPLFLSLVRKDGTFAGEFVGTLDYLGESLLTIAKSRGNETDVHNNIEFLKANYGNYKQFVDEWELKLDESKNEGLGDMSGIFGKIDISSFPETAEEYETTYVDEETGLTLDIVDYKNVSNEPDEDIEEIAEEIVELPEIKTDKMYVYDYIPNKYYLVQCHTMLGTINFSLVNNHMDVMGKMIPLYSIFVVQYNQGTSLGQIKESINLRDYNMAIPDRIVDELSEAVNYIAERINEAV